jgi:hypothetical protein
MILEKLILALDSYFCPSYLLKSFKKEEETKTVKKNQLNKHNLD